MVLQKNALSQNALTAARAAGAARCEGVGAAAGNRSPSSLAAPQGHCPAAPPSAAPETFEQRQKNGGGHGSYLSQDSCAPLRLQLSRHSAGAQVVHRLLQTACAHDAGADIGIGEAPGHGELRNRAAEPLRNRPQPLGDPEVVLLRAPPASPSSSPRTSRRSGARRRPTARSSLVIASATASARSAVLLSMF